MTSVHFKKEPRYHYKYSDMSSTSSTSSEVPQSHSQSHSRCVECGCDSGIKRVAFIGAGFIGGPASAVIAFKTNTHVTVVDIDAKLIAAWNSDDLPLYEPYLKEVVAVARDGVQVRNDKFDQLLDSYSFPSKSRLAKPKRKAIYGPNLVFSTDIDNAITNADIIFICVNTPTKVNGLGKGYALDLKFVEAAARRIGSVARTSKIIVEKSTVPCQTASNIRDILKENAKPGVRFEVLSNPEFLSEGTAVKNLLYPDRVIIGSNNDVYGRRAAECLVELYSAWVHGDKIITVNIFSSELSKLAANALLAQRVSSINALSAICEATGADIGEVEAACGFDSRIGPKMLRAGLGFGGSNFTKDIRTLIYLSESLHLQEVAEYWRSIITLNEYQKDRFARRILSCLSNTLTNKKIVLLGFAFKKNTNDSRESPAISVTRALLKEHAKINIYDPVVRPEQIWDDLFGKEASLEPFMINARIYRNAYEACEGADAVVILTDWDTFSNKEWESEGSRHRRVESMSAQDELEAGHSYRGNCRVKRLDWAKIGKIMKKPTWVFDGRNVIDKGKLEALGFHVKCIGK